MLLRRNVLIFHSGALGDFVLTWPTALAMGRLFPQSRVLYVTHGQKGALAERVLKLEYSDVEMGWHCLHGQVGKLPPQLGRLLCGAHTVLSFAMGDDRAWTENVRRVADEEARIITVAPNPPQDCAEHVTQHVLKQLASWPAGHAAVAQMLRAIEDRGVRYDRGVAEIDVVIHPGSGSAQKCWGLEQVAELVRRLKAEGRSVQLVIGEAEVERWGGAQMGELARLAEMRRPQTYLALLDELGRGRVVLTNDSGPGHLASITGMRTLALFGPTDPGVWAPLGPSVRILRAADGDMQSLKPSEVYESLTAMLSEGGAGKGNARDHTDDED
jgi:ADP-heptose:LPS heptosyltransferase